MGGELGPIYHNTARTEAYLRTNWHLDPSVRLTTIDMGRKLGGCAPFRGSCGPHLTQCRLSRGLLRAKWYPDASSRLVAIAMGRKLGAVALLGGSWVLMYNTLWLRPRPTTMPSFILSHPAVGPQYTDVTDGQDR